jgi:hypothetical protein
MKNLISLFFIYIVSINIGYTIDIPSNIKVSNISDKGFTLSWTGNGISFPIYINDQYYGRLDCCCGQNRVCTISNLAVNKTYKIQISAMDMIVSSRFKSAAGNDCIFSLTPKPTDYYWVESLLSEAIYVTVPAMTIVESTDISAKGSVLDLAINSITLVNGFRYKPNDNASTYHAAIFEVSALKSAKVEELSNTDKNASELILDVNDIKVYPNPSSDEITIEQTLEHSTLQMFDMNGRLLRTIQLNSTINKVDIKSLLPGMYALKVISEKGVSKTSILKN